MTPRQAELLDFIGTFIAKHGHSPSFDEMAAGTTCSKSSVAARMVALRRIGKITYEPNMARTVEPVSRTEDPG